MGEEPSTSSEAVTGGSTPDEIQRDIEQTREQLGDTVEALAEKADVRAQAKRRVEETKATVSTKAEQAFERAKDVSPETASDAAARASHAARENPLTLASVGAFAVGFLAGRITKRS